METIKEFLSVSYGDGSGDGSGSGRGFGNGFGSGRGFGDGSGSGRGFGDGSGFGEGFGSGRGFDDGSGFGEAFGSGFGDGDGSGGLKTYNRRTVCMIDGVPTLLDKVRGGFGFGYIVNSDLTLTPCRVAKSGNTFAHGSNLKEARAALLEKLFDDMPEEERIAAFFEAHNRKDRYSGRDLWEWHHRLTGSCEMGRNQFAADRGIDIDNSSFTVAEFVELCKDSYGGEIIRRLSDDEL